MPKIVRPWFCPIHFTITFAGQTTVDRYTGNIVIPKIVKPGFHYTPLKYQKNVLLHCKLPFRISVRLPKICWEKFALHLGEYRVTLSICLNIFCIMKIQMPINLMKIKPFMPCYCFCLMNSRFLLGIYGVLKGLSRTTDSEIAMEPILWPTFSATSTVPIKD